MSRRRLGAADYRDGVRSGDRRLVAKTITLLESRRADVAALGVGELGAVGREHGDHRVRGTRRGAGAIRADGELVARLPA